MTWNNTIESTRHTCNDGRGPAFGRATAGCPRCDELIAGAKPQRGWGANKAEEAARQRRFILAAMECKGLAHQRDLNPGGYCTVCGAGYGD